MSHNPQSAAEPVRVFYSYAHEDEPFRQTLDKHLSVLKRTGVIAPWHDRRITPGRDWAKEIDRYLEEAQIILLLVSADFMSSDYCWGVEMDRALTMHDAGLARVIPIIVRPVDLFEGVPFVRLQALPQDAKPITEWTNQDSAWTDVAKGVRLASLEVLAQSVSRVTVKSVVGGDAERLDATSLGKLYEEYWARFSEVLRESGVGLRPPTASPRNYARLSLHSSDMRMNAFTSVRDRSIGLELVLRQTVCTPAYNQLKASQAEIEREFGRALEWNELQGSYRIVVVEKGFDPADRGDWARQHNWLIEQLKGYQESLLKRIADGKAENYAGLGL